jgi:hypothetical protein
VPMLCGHGPFMIGCAGRHGPCVRRCCVVMDHAVLA